MRIVDWGRFDGELVLFGGAYSNLQATEGLLAVLRGRPAINTGDLTAYCADPAPVIAKLQDFPTIAGNCELQLAAGAEDCGCGFEEGSTCSVLSGAWFAHASGLVDQAARRWMRDLPDIGVFVFGHKRYAVIHGGVRDVSRFLWSVSRDDAFLQEISTLEAALGRIDGVIAGHSGIAFTRRIGRWDWINAGVIGMPENDGLRETRYAVLSADGVRLERLAYDWQGAQAAMIAAGLVQGYERALETGYWPSEDVLPDEMKRNAAQVASASG